MDPAAELDTGVVTLGGLLREAGPGAVLAFAAGVAILALAVRLARRRGPRHLALALFAASWVALLPVAGSHATSAPTTLAGMTLRWSAPGAASLALVVPPVPPRTGALFVASAGLLLGLTGSTLALARSRPGAARPA